MRTPPMDLPFVHFPERAMVFQTLLSMARKEVEPGLWIMPAETNAGKTRLRQFLTQEAELPKHAAIGLYMAHYGAEPFVNAFLETLELEVPITLNDYGNGSIVPMRQSLPIEQAMTLLESALASESPGLLLVDDADGMMRQQSISGTRWLQGFLRALILRHRMRVVLTFCPDYDWPTLPGIKANKLMLGTISDSNECRSFLDAIQHDTIQRWTVPVDGGRFDRLRANKINVTGRLSDSDIVEVLLARNHGMLGFVEDDARALLVGDASCSSEKLPGSLRERLHDQRCRRQYLDGKRDFRGEVYASLRSAYDRQA